MRLKSCGQSVLKVQVSAYFTVWNIFANIFAQLFVFAVVDSQSANHYICMNVKNVKETYTHLIHIRW